MLIDSLGPAQQILARCICLARANSFENEDEDDDEEGHQIFTPSSPKLSNAFTKSTVNLAAMPPSITR